MSGFPRVLNFHLTGQTAGGNATTELRIGPAIERAFTIKRIAVVPFQSSGVGQFVDVLITGSDYSGDAATAPGVSILEAAQGGALLPTEDQERGLPVTDSPYWIDFAHVVAATSQRIAVQSRFTAPALALPVAHIVVVVEEYDTPPVVVDSRPPIGVPPLVAPPPPSATPPPVYAPPAPAPVQPALVNQTFQWSGDTGVVTAAVQALPSYYFSFGGIA